tara:strand:+ start:13192 stop:14499 length:1308 start_codon:yes stop_codon:yes gene_type:complete
MLKEQKQYEDPFKVVQKGYDKYWRPHFISLLGFASNILENIYECKEKREDLRLKINRLSILTEKQSIDDIDKKVGNLRLELEKEEKNVDTFNFYNIENDIIENVVKELDEKIHEKSKEKYYLSKKIRGLEKSLSNVQVKYSPDKISSLFSEAGIAFDGRIKKSYEDLISFNKSITVDRRKTFNAEIKKSKEVLESLNADLSLLEVDKASKLKVLTSNDSISKFKDLQNILNQKRLIIAKELDIRKDIVDLEKMKVDKSVEDNRLEALKLDLKNDQFNNNYLELKDSFESIMKYVVSATSSIDMKVLPTGTPEFSIIFKNVESYTSQGDGESYNKIKCIALILSILKIYKNSSFINFTYLDGVFETLDPRKQKMLLDTLVEYANKYDIQIIITALSSDIPKENIGGEVVPDLEIFNVLRCLHEDGDDGRLFRMERW